MNDTNPVTEIVEDAQRLNNVFDAQIRYEYLSYNPDIVYQDVQDELHSVSNEEVDSVADLVEEKTGIVFTETVREHAAAEMSDVSDVNAGDVLVQLFYADSEVQKVKRVSENNASNTIFQMFIKVRSVGVNTTKAIRHFIMKIASQTRLTKTKTTNQASTQKE